MHIIFKFRQFKKKNTIQPQHGKTIFAINAQQFKINCMHSAMYIQAVIHKLHQASKLLFL